MAKPKMIKQPPKRYKKSRDRVWIFDFRSIQNHAPNKTQQKLLQRHYRSYRGEKPTFTSPEQLQVEIDQYFESCYGPKFNWKTGDWVKDGDGNIVKFQVEPFTVNGLAYWIGISTEALDKFGWGCFDDLAETDEDKLYSVILQRAKQKIALYAEKRLYDRDGVNGAKFVLDHHFRMVTQRDAAEIEAQRKTLQYKMQELELKQRALDIGTDEDGPLTIKIVRKED